MKSITRDGKRHHKPKGTTLWYVYLCLSDNTVYVSAIPNPKTKYPFNDTMRIRTLTPRAAARKYIRDNLVHRLAVLSVEDRYGIFYPVRPEHRVDFVDKQDIKKAKKFAPKNVAIKVLK